MEVWVLFGVFTLLLLIGTPVAFCLGIASLATVLYMGLPPIVVFQQLNSGMNAFAMLAIPFFIYAGDLIWVADLSAAGVVPGFLLAAALMVTAYVVAVRRGYPADPFPGFRMLAYFFASAVPGILLIFIIFGGVRSGVFTAAESSCIAVVYALLVTLFVYRELNWQGFVEATLGAVRTTAMVLLVIGTASAFGWLMAFLQVPQATITLMKTLSD